MSLLCGTPGGSVDIDATRVTTRDPGRNEALWITARAEKCLWIAPRYARAADGQATGGPGRGAGGWRQGQGGPRDRSLRAAGSRVAISRAGRHPPARTAARLHRFGGRRRDRRARAGFETRHRAKRGCLVSRAAGASGAWKTRGATSNMRDHAGPPPTGTSSSLNLQGRVMKPPNPSGGERLHAATYQTARAGKSSRALVSRTWEGPGIRRRTRGRRLPPRPRPTRYLPRSCGAGCRWTLPRRPGTRRGCAS